MGSNRLFAESPRKHPKELAPSVQALVEYVKRPENDFLRIYIGSMLDAANQKNPLNIKTPADFFQQLDNALYSLPKYDANFMAALPFYTVLQPFMENGPGWAFFTNEGIRPYFSAILKAYHDKLETPASLAYMNDSYGNWLSADAREYLSLDDYVYSPSAPHGGFKSWNEFFIRKFKNLDASRPLAPDPSGKAIISPVDGQVWKISKQVQREATFDIKGEQYYLTDLLNEPADSPFLSHVNTRTVLFIESIGEVAMVFVGLTEVSSCVATVKAGDLVQRGDDIGHFAFGGSTGRRSRPSASRTVPHWATAAAGLGRSSITS
ncbi:hypothetical protein HJC22_26555 [Corallococcus exiguus]|uniref:phosphatidylserine decarboxylase family protein n=1 Tax=Corallococcus exiguus TaxID=83462 RepID=UPI001471022D|nr:phosphatidylserine decarboxylase family protein [Corallococcus exiguus]NNC19285.1 hypothetical protein [Corallococcus exiguus]